MDTFHEPQESDELADARERRLGVESVNQDREAAAT